MATANVETPHGGGFYGYRAAVGFVGAFLLLLAVVALTLYLDKENRGTLESVSANTAVGDSQFYVPEWKISHHDVAVVYNGKDLYFAYLTPLKIDDTTMRKIGVDDSGEFNLYSPEKTSLQTGHDSQQLYYVKHSPGKYYQLQSTPGGLNPPIVE